MIKNKLFYIFLSFNRSDWNNFGKYVSSPYLVKGNFSKRIFKSVKLFFLSTKDKTKITPEMFQKKLERIRISEKYSTYSFTSKLSVFYSNLEKYLILNNFDTDVYQNHKYLLFELTKRNLESNIESEIKYINRITERGILKTYDIITVQEISFTAAVFFLSHNKNKKAFEMFFKQSEYFTLYFLEGLIYHLLQIKNINKHKHKTEETLFQILSKYFDIDSIIKEIELLSSNKFDSVLIAYYLLKISEQKNVIENIKKLKTVFFENEEKYETVFRVFVYIELGTAYQKLIDKGETKYYKDNFELLKRQDEKGLIIHIQKGIFALNFFFSCINIGLKMNEIIWVEIFIKKYYKQLPDDIKLNEFNVGIAMVQFHKKEYEEALASLDKCKNILFSKADFRYSILRLKIFYETSRIEDAYLEMDRFAHRIKNDKNISSDTKRQGRFFKLLYSKLLKRALEPKIKEYDDFSLLLANNDEKMLEKEWFIEKINKTI